MADMFCAYLKAIQSG